MDKRNPKPRQKGAPRERVVITLDPIILGQVDRLKPDGGSRSRFIEKLIRIALTPEKAA